MNILKIKDWIKNESGKTVYVIEKREDKSSLAQYYTREYMWTKDFYSAWYFKGKGVPNIIIRAYKLEGAEVHGHMFM